ncbi:MAG TPA: SRPBCC family protein [Dehalococcoidia bacterium]|nr:SRPBCC family protein [Dehalococcoidia bacterium]
MRIVKAVTIPAPRETVWRTFVDLARWPEWSPWRLNFPGEARFQIGAEFQVAVRAPGFPFLTLKFPCRITELENPQVVCWAGSVLGAPGFHRFVFESASEGCFLLSEEELEGPRDLLLWPVKRIIEGRATEFLVRLSEAAVLRAR